MRPRVVCLAAVLGIALAVPAGAAAERDYGIRFTTNAQGDVTGTGNTLMSCRNSDPKCDAARNGTAGPTNADDNNNNRFMTYADVDDDPSTFNSSSATLKLPAGARVLFAGLYYGGDPNAGSGGAPAPNPALRNRVLFKPPGLGDYLNLKAIQVDDAVDSREYQGIVDVTDLVRAAGPGTYAVANVQLGTGLNSDEAGGWALAVAYEDTNQPTRNLTLFDGFHFVLAGGPPVTIPLSGFITPRSGQVSTRVGLVALEGDLGTTGDSATLNGRTLTNATNPATNFFNSSISTGAGTTFHDKDPDYLNQLGFDADIFDASGLLQNGQQSTTLVLATSGDGYVPNAISFATDLFAPAMRVTKQVDKSEAQMGDVLTYTMSVTNSGLDAADNTSLRDPIPSNGTYVPGSLQVVSGANSGPKSDAPGDDQAEFDSDGNAVVLRLGNGASSTAGGQLPIGGTTTVSFQVKVNDGLPTGATLVNDANVSFISDTLGQPGQVTSPDVTTTVKVPDLSINKSHVGGFVSGRNVDFSIDVTNVGDAPTRGTVTVTDPMPDHQRIVGKPAGTGWDCSSSTTDKLACSRDDPLQPNDSYPTIQYTTRISSDAPEGTLRNTAKVSGGGDGNDLNNTDTDEGEIAKPRVDMAIQKVTLTPRVFAGDEVRFRIRVTNLGDDDATRVRVEDLLPSGLTPVSVTTSHGFCLATNCFLGRVRAGQVVQIGIVAIAGRDTGGQRLVNPARVEARETDPTPDNNHDSSPVRIGKLADIVVTKTALAPSLPAGSTVSYTIVVHNDGPSTATNVVLNDLVPAGLTPISATPTQGTCPTPTSCNLGSLTGQQSAQVVIVASSAPGLAGSTLTNTATADASEPDPNPANNTDSTDVTFTALPPTVSNVAVTKTADALVVDVGGILTYTLKATNNGPDPAADALVTDTPDPALAVLSVDPRQGACALGPVITCHTGPLAVGASATITVRALVLAAGTLTNAVTAITPGGAGAVDARRARATVPPIVTLIKRARPRVVRPGGRVTFTFSMHARGRGTAHHLVLCDRLPIGLTVVERRSFRRVGARWCTHISSLSAGHNTQRSLVVSASSASRARTVVNVATLTVPGRSTRTARARVRIRSAAPKFTG